MVVTQCLAIAYNTKPSVGNINTRVTSESYVL